MIDRLWDDYHELRDKSSIAALEYFDGDSKEQKVILNAKDYQLLMA